MSDLTTRSGPQGPTVGPPGIAWPSGVGGVQCDGCDRVTIVRGFDRDYMDEPQSWLCRPCAFGATEGAPE